jgi:hypothetical protein
VPIELLAAQSLLNKDMQMRQTINKTNNSRNGRTVIKIQPQSTPALYKHLKAASDFDS